MSPRRTRQEEGQVTPALLLAVIGGFALAVAFVSLQNLVDQAGRSDTAADAAALAAGKAHGDAIFTVFDGNSGLHLGVLRHLLEGGPVPDVVVARAEQAARDYADANGADVLDVRYDGFDLGARQWEYTVETKQQDPVEGAGKVARTESRSRVAVRVTGGVCSGGLVVGGDCRPFELLDDLCQRELEPPEPSPTAPEPEPAEPPFTPPPGLEGVGCLSGADLQSLVPLEIRLIT